MKACNKGTCRFAKPLVLKRAYGICTDSDANHNKAYSAELHQDEGTSNYTVFVSYGRVGEKMAEREYLNDNGSALSQYEAEQQYNDLLKDKFGAPKCSACGNKTDVAGVMTCSKCSRKYNFKDYTKKYVPVDLAQAKVGSDHGKAIVDTTKLTTASQAQVQPDPTTVMSTPSLAREIVSFLTHIFEEAGQAARSSLNTGVLKATADNPLGTLSQAQLEDGRGILDEIRLLLLDGKDHATLMKLTTGFYSTIPQQIDRRPDWNRLCIDNLPKLSTAIDLIDLLSDVKGVQTSFKSGTTDWDRYDSVGADLEVVDRNDPVWKKLEQNALNSRAHNHRQYDRMKVRNIFKLRVSSQKDHNWLDPNKVGNVQALYHGSRNANILGITTKGLLLRPPGAVITGSMYGAGLYFGSNSSKSLQYSQGGWGGTGNRSNNVYLYVCSLALGRIKEYTTAQTHLTAPPSGYHSVKGVPGVQLVNEEYIVYTLRQHRLDYIMDISPDGR